MKSKFAVGALERYFVVVLVLMRSASVDELNQSTIARE